MSYVHQQLNIDGMCAYFIRVFRPKIDTMERTADLHSLHKVEHVRECIVRESTTHFMEVGISTGRCTTLAKENKYEAESSSK